MTASRSGPQAVRALGLRPQLTLGTYVSLYGEVAQASADAGALFITRRGKIV
jgi:hypothetical protein